jgi:Domain of unknown function (DUF4129)
MAAGAFEKTSFGWQIQQSGQRAAEWIELQFSRVDVKTPKVEPGWQFPEWLNSFSLWLALVILGVFLVWVSQLLYRVFWPHLRAWRPGMRFNVDRPTPNTVPQLSVDAWLQQAREFQRQGNYREACRTLYMAMLQKFHDAKVLPHLGSRTDREYLQQVESLYVRSLLPQIHPYRTLLTTHERLCFSQTDISATDFQDCQQAYQQIELTAGATQEGI